jgi:hypothetical protein
MLFKPKSPKSVLCETCGARYDAKVVRCPRCMSNQKAALANTTKYRPRLNYPENTHMI